MTMFVVDAADQILSSSRSSSCSCSSVLLHVRYVDNDQNRKFSVPMKSFSTQQHNYSCNSLLRSDHRQISPMAEDHNESRKLTESTSTSSPNNSATIVTTNVAYELAIRESSKEHFQDHEHEHHRQNQDQDHEDQHGWLELSIGGRHAIINNHNSSTSTSTSQAKQQTPRSMSDVLRSRDKLVELDLLPPGTRISSSTFLQQQQQQQQQVMNAISLADPVFHQMPQTAMFGARQPLTNYTTTSASTSNTYTSIVNMNYTSSNNATASNLLQLQHYPPQIIPNDPNTNYWPGFRPTVPSSSSSFPPPGYYYSGLPPLQIRSGAVADHQAAAGPGPGPTPSLDFKVVDPPRRPHSGIWFMLQASQIQSKEPFLPQIPKSYLRIRDGRMTVRLVMKYLVNKLRLESESEIEITCRGQQLLPFLTLQHVRDNVWSSNNINTIETQQEEEGSRVISNLVNYNNHQQSSSSFTNTTSDHLMLLHYGWSTNS